MTLIEMQNRSATVVAATAAVLYELTAQNLYTYYKAVTRAYVIVLQNVNRELCRRLAVVARMSVWRSWWISYVNEHCADEERIRVFVPRRGLRTAYLLSSHRGSAFRKEFSPSRFGYSVL